MSYFLVFITILDAFDPRKLLLLSSNCLMLLFVNFCCLFSLPFLKKYLLADMEMNSGGYIDSSNRGNTQRLAFTQLLP